MERYYHIAKNDLMMERGITYGIMRIDSEGKPSKIWGENIKFKGIHTRTEGCFKIGDYYQIVVDHTGKRGKENLGVMMINRRLIPSVISTQKDIYLEKISESEVENYQAFSDSIISFLSKSRI